MSAASSAAPTRRQLFPIQVLWFTSMVSLFGNTLTAVAVPWFVLESTGSATRTGITAAVTVIPVVFATFFGGALVDRTSYRGLSVFSDLISACTVAAIPIFYLTTGLSFPGLLILMFLGSIFDAPGGTARNAMIPQLSRLTGVSIERINANFGMVRAATSLFSAPLAGLAIAWFGAVNVLWFNAGTFVFSALAVWLFIPVLSRPEASGGSFTEDVRFGFAYVRDNILIRNIISYALLINFLFAPLFGVAIPFFANQELQSVRSLGIMLGGEGLGALAGAYLYGRLAPHISRHTFLVTAAVFLALPIVPLAFSTSLGVTTVLLVLIGIGSGLVNPMVGAFLQLTTPEALLGRVSGVFMAGALVAQPIGLLIGGAFIGLLGFQTTTIVIGVLMVMINAVIVLNPTFRDLDRIPDPATEVEPEVAEQAVVA